MTERVEQLFYELAPLSPGARAQYFAEHAVDNETRRQVEALLTFDATDDGSTLIRRIGAEAGQALAELGAKGGRCGPFRLLRVIGRGGMGVVYLAERADGEVTQSAAVKLLQPGMNDIQHERFLQERQILAGLAHPNIARLLDAGHTEDGQPYLAMEYVEGVPVDVFMAALSIRQKISLFLKVCDAVAYLHRNLVVHRDLKPSNILVTSGGEPKLLDFGIAKMLDIATDATVTGMRMLTPDYASPEQVLGERIGTTSDVYSLGAVLYQLLTGQKPHRFGDSSPSGLAAAIVRTEVTRPSVWSAAMKGDLDAVLLMALRKEPRERYSTVEQLAEDLEAFLHSRPVRARKGGLLYRVRKFTRRYWMPVAAATLAIAGLAVGLYAINRERADAQRRFDEVRQLSNELLDIDREVSQLQGGSRTRQRIVDISLDYLRRLGAEAPDDPELALDVATAYMRVGRVQGVPISSNLGQMEHAEQSLQRAETLVRSVLQVQPGNRTASFRMAQISHDRMFLARLRRPDSGSLRLAHQAEEWWDRYLKRGAVDEREKDQVGTVGTNVADVYVRNGEVDAAVKLLSRVTEIARATGRPVSAGNAQSATARAHRSRGDLDRALAAATEAIGILEPPPGEQAANRRVSFGLALAIKGEILGEDNAISMGRFRDAAEFLESGFRMAADQARLDANDTNSRFSVSARGISLAGALRHFDQARSLVVYEEVLSRMAEVKNNSRARRDEVRALAGSTYPLRQAGREGEARRRAGAALALLRNLNLYPAKQVLPGSEPEDALRALADHEAATGGVQRAIQVYTELLDLMMASKPLPESNLYNAVHLSTLYEVLGGLYRRAGQAEAAGAMDARRVGLWREWERALPNNSFVRRQLRDLPAK